jgi:hypothetical protein
MMPVAHWRKDIGLAKPQRRKEKELCSLSAASRGELRKEFPENEEDAGEKHVQYEDGIRTGIVKNRSTLCTRL